MADILIFPHYEQLFPTPSTTYRDQVQTLLRAVFRDEAWCDWIAACFRHPCLGLPDADSAAITHALEQLCQQRADLCARAALDHLTRLIPPATPCVECHLHPGRAPDRGGGMSFAPGKMLIGVPISDDWAVWVQRNCAHEYSHTVRMALWPQDERHGYGPAMVYTIRQYLVFEGLAHALADELYPAPILSLALDPAAEQAYWDLVAPHLDETGWPAYIAYVLGDAPPHFPGDMGGKVGQQIVNSYMSRQGIHASELQKTSYEELYWNSGYPYIR